MRPRRHGMDYLLFLTVAAICAFGVVMLFSASYYYAQSFQGDGYYYVKKQLIFLAIGIPVMFGLSFVDYKFYRRFAWMAYLLIILLLIAVLLFGKNLQGGQRWLKIGPLQFQPSELAKFIIVICMAKYMTACRSRRVDLFSAERFHAHNPLHCVCNHAFYRRSKP